MLGELVLLIAVWYGSSCIAITTSKICMTAARVPFVLCSTQCLTAVLTTRGYLWLLGRGNVSRLRRPAEKWAVLKVSVGYSAGFALTNVAFAMASAPFVETVKAAEPVSTALLAIALLGERERAATYAALVPIVLGVAAATGGGGSGDSLFSLAALTVVASNLCFSLRAVFAKALKAQHPGSAAARSAIALFYHVSRYGLPGFLAAAVLRGDVATLVSAVVAKYSGDDSGHPRPSSSSTAGQVASLERPHTFLAALVANGLAYTTYNMASFMVLARVSTTTHAVLNVFRRVVVIGVTAIYFREPMTASGLAGVLTAAFGVAVYASSKQQHAQPSAASSPSSHHHARSDAAASHVSGGSDKGSAP
mmetsp:Transcript_26569/g.106391  ORF Transcript_26569/g.106391 Transcript_26569/m.106391 type:complete len:364 (+) Transcript_26569:296-1387(+)